jgi:DNA-binding beta-propeller fold protein YncE
MHFGHIVAPGDEDKGSGFLDCRTHINKAVAVANLVQQTVSEGSQRRAQLNRLSEPQAIAVDNAAGRLYWTDTGVHKIYRANLHGLSRQPLVEWGPNPRGIAVVRDKIYWIDSGNHQIHCSNLDGSGHHVIVKWVPNPQGIAVDDVGGKIYWTDSGTHKIHRANLNGSGCETLVKWSYNPRGIAVDRIDGKIYRADSRTHQISRANLDGS